ncbi:MAG: GTPase HflX [Fimbriimonadaceae bacterium]|nr:GTPase HflX [Fimbriimonadaceae bacterium]
MSGHALEEARERILAVFVNPDAEDDEYSELEFGGLVEAAQGEVVGTVRQRVDRPTSATFVRSGKVQEIAGFAAELDADVVAFDCELTGVQIRNLEEAIEKRVIDRPTLILDIFARRAHTKEGQLQVELAMMSYRLPRLMSVYTKFERQKGGIGMRGPGETKLESDRRMVKARIAKLTEEIAKVKEHREQQRQERERLPYPLVSLVGYTSAGKSTLMNRIADTAVLADAMPFATLDPTTRLVTSETGSKIFLSDTVGFIRRLPTTLVAAFRATLEEVARSHLLLHVVDASLDGWEIQRDAVLDTLEVIGAADLPILTVFNKSDLLAPGHAERIAEEWPGSVAVSALHGEGVGELLRAVQDRITIGWREVDVLLPYDQSSLIESCHKYGRVLSEEYTPEGVAIRSDVPAEWAERLAAFARK